MPSAVDTNVLVRFLVDDGSNHVAPTRKLFAAEMIFVPTTVILETEWVLRSNFSYPRNLICDAFDRLLGLQSVLVEDADLVADAIDAHRKGLDFADALHLFASTECDRLYTFDAPFIRKANQAGGPIPVNRPGSANLTS